MIAKIVTAEKREYYSTVFAISYNGFNTAVIVFDNEKDEFSFVKMYERTVGLIRRVFLIDMNETDFEEKDQIKISPLKTLINVNGYAWLLNSPDLVLDIIKHRPLDKSLKEKAKELNRLIEKNEWRWVKNEDDAKSLLTTTWGFHDGTIETVSYDCQTNAVTVVVSGCWAARITMIFQSEPRFHFYSDDDSSDMIMDANVFFENGFVYWVDSDSIRSEADLKKYCDLTYFKARALKWKMDVEYEKNDNQGESD